MTPESLIEKLANLGTIDSKVLRKLRRQVENPDKSASVNQILSYLIKKEQISKAEAVALKAVDPDPTSAPRHDETDDLLAGVLDPVIEPEPEPDPPAPAAAPVEEEPPTAEVMDAIEDAIPHADVNYEALPDEPAEVFADAMTADNEDLSGSYATPKAKGLSFAGKRNTSDQWATKWIYIGFGMLGLLLIGGTLLFLFLSLISAEDRFEAAMNSYTATTYGDAIKKFDEFLAKHPTHEKAPAARVRRAHSLIIETYKQKNWDETILRVENELPPLVQDEDIDLEDIRQDLAVMLPGATLAMARRATKQDTKAALIEQLNKAKKAKLLVDNPVYIPNSRKKQATVAKLLDDIDEEIAKGDGLIRKQEQFDEALVKIAAFRERGETDQAFVTYNELIRSYGDLRANDQLQKEMRLVSQQEGQLVENVDAAIIPTVDSRSTAIRSSIVLASRTGNPISTLTGEVIPVLADGAVYGVDVGTGAVRWRRHVGYKTIVQPVRVGTDAILVSDQTRNDLIMVNAIDGSVQWRDAMGEAFLAPTVNEDTAIVTTESGRIFQVELATGAIQAAVKIPQPANVGVVRSKRSGLVFQTGFYSNLYILSGDDLACQDVFYLGHARGSISVPPVVWNNLILVAVNQSGVCDLSVLAPGEEGEGLQLVQRIRRVTRGIVTSPLVRFGRFMLITSETGDVKILEINTAEENNPIRILAEEKFENRDRTYAHLVSEGSQLWIGVKGITRYKVSRAQATIERQKISNSDDFFIGPIRKFGDAIVHVRKRSRSALVSVSAVDSETLEQIWRTDLGGPLAGPPMVSGDKITAISSQGDMFTVMSDSMMDQVAADEVKSSNIAEDLLFDRTIALSATTQVCMGPPGRPNILYVDTAAGSSKLLTLPRPANNSIARAIRIGTHLIIPSAEGPVVRVNPKNSSIVGGPFLPPSTPGETARWTQPAAVSADRFVIGGGSNFYLVDASSTATLRKLAESTVDGVLKSDLVAAGEIVFAVIEKEAKQQLIAFRVAGDLQLAGAIELEGRLAAGPWVNEQGLMLQMSDQRLVCFDDQLSSKWTANLAVGTLAAPPIARQGQVQVYFSDGRLVTLNAANGELENEVELGQPIIHIPAEAKGGFVFSGLDGTLHDVKWPNP